MEKNKMYLYGKNSVLERLKKNPASVKKIFALPEFSDERIMPLAASRRINISRVGERKLAQIKRADRLQGIVAEVDKFLYADFEDLLHKEKFKNTALIFLDGINDPHNLGSVIRIAACFGNFACVIQRHGSCEVTDAVMHVASGGENYAPVALVTNFATALIEAKKAGRWVVGAVVENGTDINKAKLPFPICLVLGSEGKGIRHGLEKHLDQKVSLPMRGAALSFNVAMASAIFCYEIDRQRQVV